MNRYSNGFGLFNEATQRSWLSHYAIRRKIVAWIPNEVV
jgi:hypothetical protein